ncbi:unnamed protein product [Camellia sinensis]
MKIRRSWGALEESQQDTLKSPPPENRTMKTASMSAIFITTFFYLCCGCFGYAAFGDKTPGNLLSGIQSASVCNCRKMVW